MQFNLRSRKTLIALMAFFCLGIAGVALAGPLSSILAQNSTATPAAIVSPSPAAKAATTSTRSAAGIDRLEGGMAPNPSAPTPGLDLLSSVLAKLPTAQPSTPSPVPTPVAATPTPVTATPAAPLAATPVATTSVKLPPPTVPTSQPQASVLMAAPTPKPAKPEPPPPPALNPTVTTPPVPAVDPAILASLYQPQYKVAWAHPTNYGERMAQDAYGRPVQHQPLIVLHETVAPASSVLSYFQSAHPKDSDQASYHTLVNRDGTVVYIVPPDKRAYGAGNSVFNGPGGPEAVKTQKEHPPSVNNFAYHISLESPPDGYGQTPGHSGYTDAQYRSLAWLIAQSTVPVERITTHREVDRSGERVDPRSFRRDRLIGYLEQLRSS